MRWVLAILVFSVLILVHELGHFLSAKLNGVDVEEFSLGFGPEIVGTNFHGTRYSLKLLLFGGSCRMRSMMERCGMDDGSMDPEPEEGEFESVSHGRQAAILFAGPLFNFLLAFVCAVILTGAIGYDPATVTDVVKGSEAGRAGLKAGDAITSFMGHHVNIGRDIYAWEYFNGSIRPGETITVSYIRNGQEREASFVPDQDRSGGTGFAYNLHRKKTDAPGVLKYSLVELRFQVGIVLKSVAGMFTGKFKLRDLSGPVGIADTVEKTYEQDRSRGLFVTAMDMLLLIVMFSANLGVMNLLPIPGFDGGKIVAVLVEAASGKRISWKVKGVATIVSAFLLLLLMVFVAYQDIIRFLAR